ncbi:transglutaminase family protein [Patescibacteria group bacterium]|nr:transglutaminase family protein [Patescibacteria group bacterium]MBU0845712.1 transglutaminase family protein [Patescibacteria group bacterium]MBU0923057.1 transglutaminase family protein [Patescibacteria group bacterium]MBU1066608.1 transglutaminase family protein [Patescibacteria group bacterium]MBU1844881.1 transglutaminase family protein [Patescibacteria group bacterium]
MFKKIIVSFVAFLIFLIIPSKVHAQEEFIIDVNVNYSVLNTGITKVTHTITLENALSNLYAQSYLLSLENIDPLNPVSYEGDKQLALTKTEKDDTVSLQVNFDDAAVGKGKIRTFTISFEEANFASRTGEVWEISIPRLSESNNFRSYNVNLIVPSSFGKEAYISPDPKSTNTGEGTIIYSFDKTSIQKTGITAGFGKFQVFSFTLNYHLENPLNKTASTEIAIPPDTAFQKIYYDSINPAPEEVYLDKDGNWLAVYILDPRERIDVTVMGTVQIYANPREVQTPTFEVLQENLKESEYWQVNDPQIQNLAGYLRTPEAIYDFVSTNLSYSYDRVKPNVTRYGASMALNSPNEAICMEYTDLFIALTRAAGIPAREINGFAYTENPEIQPLSLVADVLHSWPEYWDEHKQVWIPVDPTWGSTTGGVDFFNKLDLRHFTFVIHGTDAIMPYPPGSYKLGPSPQKDVFVNFGQLPKEKISKPEINVSVKNSLPFMDTQVSAIIKNPGPTALYNLEPAIYFDEILAERTIVPVLPPYASYEFKSRIPFSFLGTNTPEKVVVTAADTKVQIPSNKTQVIIYNLLAIFIAFSLIIAVVVVKIKKISFVKVKNKLGTIIASLKFKKKDNKKNNIQP